MSQFRCLIPALALAAFCAGAGCNSNEPPVYRKTISEIDAEITKVQADVNMPSQAKSMAMGALQRERESAAKSAAGRK